MNARSQAAHTLHEIERRKTLARHVWDAERSGAETTLVLGVLRRRATLDAVLAAHSARRLALIKPETRAVLRCALFELLFLDDAPDHAVIHAAVDNARGFGRIKDLGFINAVLRAVQRGSRRVPPAEALDLRRALPRADETILFSKSVFPDRNHDAAAFLAARCSTAPWIARRRFEELGFDRARDVLDLQATTPPTHLRPAPGREPEVLRALDAAGIVHRAGRLVTLPPTERLGPVFEACGRWIVVQDCVASQVAPFAAPAPGSRVLDYCAAPGGKATHLAQLVGESGRVTAWDHDAARLALVAENAARLGLAQLVCGEPEGEYETVLVDAPCSNTGVLARRPEARWRVRERHLAGLAQRQLKILRDAAAFVAPAATLVYSTCSLEPEENLGIVHAFVERGGFRLEEARTIYPDEAEGDGGFLARLRRV